MNEVVNIIAMQNHTEITILVITFLLKLFWVRCTFIFIPDEKIVLLKAVQEIVTIGFLCSVYIFCWSYPSCSMRCRSSGKSTRPYQSSTYSEINDKLEWIINTMDTILLKAKKINVDFCKRTCFNLSIISNVYLFLWIWQTYFDKSVKYL